MYLATFYQHEIVNCSSSVSRERQRAHICSWTELTLSTLRSWEWTKYKRLERTDENIRDVFDPRWCSNAPDHIKWTSWCLKPPPPLHYQRGCSHSMLIPIKSCPDLSPSLVFSDCMLLPRTLWNWRWTELLLAYVRAGKIQPLRDLEALLSLFCLGFGWEANCSEIKRAAW